MHQQQYWLHVEAADASAAVEETFAGAADASAAVEETFAGAADASAGVLDACRSC